MIGSGVGRSGSPTPRLITSRPAAMAAFFFLSISANRYGGSFRSRSDFTNGILSFVRGPLPVVGATAPPRDRRPLHRAVAPGSLPDARGGEQRTTDHGQGNDQ